MTKVKDHNFWINNYQENGLIQKHVPKVTQRGHDVKQMDTFMNRNKMMSDDNKKNGFIHAKKSEKVEKGSSRV